MISAFVDASVLFAAAYSSTGAARDLVRLALNGHIELVVSQFVLLEVQRNLASKAPEKTDYLLTLLETDLFTRAPAPTREEVLEAAQYTALKDAAVIAAALKANVDFLITYDRKHLIDPPQVSERSRLRIVTPDVAIQALDAHNKPGANGES